MSESELEEAMGKSEGVAEEVGALLDVALGVDETLGVGLGVAVALIVGLGVGVGVLELEEEPSHLTVSILASSLSIPSLVA